jgi:CRISPR/Cas system-associated endonuclease Cas1
VQLLSSKAIKPSDFIYEKGACLITANAKKRFIGAIESKFQTSIQFRELGVTTDYRRIIDLQILSFKQALLDEESESPKFHTFKIR